MSAPAPTAHSVLRLMMASAWRSRSRDSAEPSRGWGGRASCSFFVSLVVFTSCVGDCVDVSTLCVSTDMFLPPAWVHRDAVTRTAFTPRTSSFSQPMPYAATPTSIRVSRKVLNGGPSARGCWLPFTRSRARPGRAPHPGGGVGGPGGVRGAGGASGPLLPRAVPGGSAGGSIRVGVTVPVEGAASAAGLLPPPPPSGLPPPPPPALPPPH